MITGTIYLSRKEKNAIECLIFNKNTPANHEFCQSFGLLFDLIKLMPVLGHIEHLLLSWI